ncbi:sensor histidine kinase [Variovorax sp. LT2P21]|uniref:sensor histidine kinase n=1 Tax=Variovorax sp. LT2P21 TaxID=3443731 RepID=UPI003F47790E
MQLLPPEPPTASAQPLDYVIAFAAVMAALGLRYLLNPLLGQQGPYLILSLAIVVAAFYGGFGPALFATVLSTSIGTYLFIGGGSWQAFFQPQNISRTVLFLVIGLSIGVIGGRLRTSRHDLAASVRQLRASNRAKDNAMATLGHEIRNPLAALHTAQEVLRRAPDDAKRVVWASELIGRQVLQMTRMADDLVDLSGVMRGEFQIEKQPVDLRKVLAQALEQSGPLIAKKGHRLHTDLGTEPVEVLGDATRLVQVFANLLNNAAKYTDPGGDVTLGLRTTTARKVAVTVSDNGIGMQPGAIDDLFEPFVQAPGAASNAEGGLGLGLAIVKKIVERHGGTVSAMSAGLGQGSTVSVMLPLAPA